MAEEKNGESNSKKNQTPKEKEKKEVSKKETPKVKKEDKKVVEEKTYNYWAYCDLIGASSGTRYVAKLKFKGKGKKTSSEWKDIFKKEGIV